MLLQLFTAIVWLSILDQGHSTGVIEAGRYSILPGAASNETCASTVCVEKSAISLDAGFIALNGESCTGMTLMFADMLEKDEWALRLFFSKLLVGRLDSDLVCSQWRWDNGTDVFVAGINDPQALLTLTNSLLVPMIPPLATLAAALQGVAQRGGAVAAGADLLVTSTACVWRHDVVLSDETPSPATTPATTTMATTTTSPSSSPFTAAAESSAGTSVEEAACFPASATVRLSSGAMVRMDTLQTGDSVLVGDNRYSPVFVWTHRVAHVDYEFVRIHTGLPTPLLVTGSHLLYAGCGNARALVAARKVAVGDCLISGERSSPLLVLHVDRIRCSGLFNPHTATGDIVVDGVLASTFTLAVPPFTGHALLTPVRAAYLATRALVRIARTAFSIHSFF